MLALCACPTPGNIREATSAPLAFVGLSWRSYEVGWLFVLRIQHPIDDIASQARDAVNAGSDSRLLEKRLVIQERIHNDVSKLDCRFRCRLVNDLHCLSEIGMVVVDVRSVLKLLRSKHGQAGNLKFDGRREDLCVRDKVAFVR